MTALTIVSFVANDLYLALVMISDRNGGLQMTLGTDSVLSGLFNGFFSIGYVLNLFIAVFHIFSWLADICFHSIFILYV